MKFLLLVLFVLDRDSFSLMAGSEASTVLKVCANGWVEISCSYPNTSVTRYHSVDVVIPRRQATLQSQQYDHWDNYGNFLLYHNTTNKKLRVVVKQLQREDFGRFQCNFFPGPGSDHESSNVELAHGDNCQTLTQTGYRTSKTTLTCENNRENPPNPFFCKENSLICEEILLPNERFSLGVNQSSFSLSISNVSSEDAGVYWCGRKSHDGNYKVPVTNIILKVKDQLPPTTSTMTPGASPPSGSTTPETDGGGSHSTVVVAGLVCVALLMFVLLGVVVYKKLYKTSGKAKIIKEDHVYAEIQEKTDSGTVMNTLYVSASFSTKPPVSVKDSTVEGSTCYSTVGEHVQPCTSSTVSQSPTNPGGSFYCTINLPQHD